MGAGVLCDSHIVTYGCSCNLKIVNACLKENVEACVCLCVFVVSGSESIFLGECVCISVCS